jgi:hypothetical protein
MSSTVSVVGWLPPVPPPATGPRHAAPETAEALQYAVARTDPARSGRHAEPEWDREWFDPIRDEDPFDWLGFAAEDWAV